LTSRSSSRCGYETIVKKREAVAAPIVVEHLAIVDTNNFEI
jgi:hypothetical protein